MASETTRDDDEVRQAPGIPGMTVNEDATIRGETPDEPVDEDEDDEGNGPFDAEDGPLAVTDDDTVGVNDDDDDERLEGATEAER